MTVCGDGVSTRVTDSIQHLRLRQLSSMVLCQLVYAVTYYKTERIEYSMGVHILNNSISVLLSLFV